MRAGNYNYVCTAHSGMMTGTITVTGSGIQQNGYSQIKIYPVPASDKLTFSGILSETIHMELIDFSGRIITKEQIQMQDGEGSTAISEIQAGTYICRIISDDKTYSFEIVKW